MSHTVTVTRLRDAEHRGADYVVGGVCDCVVWRVCPEEHLAVTASEDKAGAARWHGVEHLDVLEVGWCVETGECAVGFAEDLPLVCEELTVRGTYELDVEWDGDRWNSYIGELVSPGAVSP